MRIDSLHLEGVGPFENTTIEFPRGKRDDRADVYLLVGENGCGKTTALHSLATLLSPGATIGLGVARRFRTPNSRISLSGPEVDLLAIRSGGRIDAGERMTQDDARNGLINLMRAPPAFDLWREDIIEGGFFGQRAYEWAAFAYSGNRFFERGNVGSLEENRAHPLVGSLGFSAADESQTLATWIAGQQFKRLKAIEAGQQDRAAHFKRSIETIEGAVRGIIGDDFAFHSSVDDLNVRVLLGDDVIDFDLMPAGVKSIVSWISDLLMRMDRIQWAQGVPVLEREFLLLLDEIEVHLHPAWQRKLLPAIQQAFPKAQIIASTHSPFVVASLEDGAVIELTLDEKGRSHAERAVRAPLEMSYSQTMRRLFGIESDFDVETEKLFKELQATATRVLKGESGAREELDRRAAELRTRGEEIAQLVQFELNQLNRLTPRPTGT